MKTKKTHWRCNICGAVGSIKHDSDADVHSVIQELRHAHAAEHAGSANPCKLDLTKMQVSVDKPFKKVSAR